MSGSRHAARGRDRGAAAVEMALILPLLLLIIFGALDFGLMYHDQISLNAAAREGARLSALGQGSAVNGRVQAAAADVRPSNPVTGTVVTACPASPALTDTTKVTATYSYSYITPVGAIASFFAGNSLSGSKALTGTGVFRCGG